MDEDSNKYQSMRDELADSLQLMEDLEQQTTQAKSGQLVAETIAKERLSELSNLQNKYHNLCLLNEQLETEVSLEVLAPVGAD